METRGSIAPPHLQAPEAYHHVLRPTDLPPENHEQVCANFLLWVNVVRDWANGGKVAEISAQRHIPQEAVGKIISAVGNENVDDKYKRLDFFLQKHGCHIEGAKRPRGETTPLILETANLLGLWINDPNIKIAQLAEKSGMEEAEAKQIFGQMKRQPSETKERAAGRYLAELFPLEKRFFV